MKIINPWNDEVIQTVEPDTSSSVLKKYKTAKEAQKKWKQTPLNQRIQIVKNFQKKLIEQKEILSKIQTKETGKPITQSLNEISAMENRIQFFIDETEKAITPEIREKNTTLTEQITYEPLGVIGNISAWNYPWFVGSNVYIPALLTGNAVLYKPSEKSTLIGIEMERLWIESELPQGVFQTLIGGGEIGAALLDVPIDGIYFTGSVATGKKIAKSAGEKCIPYQLELGGKDPVYVSKNADLKRAAESLCDGAFYNNGQSCCSVERIYIHQDVFDEFKDLFIQELRKLASGSPEDSKTYFSCLTQPEHAQKLKKWIDEAVSSGANLLYGGTLEEKRLLPTVLENVDSSQKIQSEEAFGPVVTLNSVCSEEEAITQMNESHYGLTAGVFTTDLQEAKRMMNQLEAGTVYWNCCDRVSPTLPWTGWKDSGVGSTLSHIGIHAFTKPKAWHFQS
ncbi:MAG: aldehyde dehydrogenase [Bdellovibrionaceae bacterium]|nr:aldehyde dehydrogenase [Pseudobdellovibrionaceae bacterium]|tara:strand:+ start:5435 stop:6787 length:1353 start_codon:yes stop_codon:yes gene_type:complete